MTLVAIMTSLAPQALKGLLTGLAKRLYFGETGTAPSNDALFEQLWGADADRQAAEAEIQSFEDLLQAAAGGHWDASRLAGRLESSSSLSGDHAKVVVAFWSSEREKIHNVLVRRSTWNGHFYKLGWRIDVKAAGKSGADVNEPVALFELRTDYGHKQTSEEAPRRQTQFEMSRAEIQKLLDEFATIETSLTKASW